MSYVPELGNFAKIKVIGVGGGGGNAINRMIKENIQGVEFIAVNTDAQALFFSEAPYQIRIGDKLTKGLGAGGDPQIGADAAKESEEELRKAVADSDMVFITAGIGGGTGTGASPLIAQLAKETGALTIGVVTKPFTFEGSRRREAAEQGIMELKERVDTLIIIPNDRLLELVDKKASIQQAFSIADDVLRQGIQGISELITVPGLINLDFADVRTIMCKGGSALMAVGKASGDTRAVDAAYAAVSSPLLDVTIDGATGVLFNVTGGTDLTLHEVDEAARVIRDMAHPDVNLIFGAVMDPEMKEGEVQITVIATGFDGAK
ncbi:MAG TPA: cell division protein FtsZ, partial [Chloroflexi bacterium]|nr:cell division protein FtsZ [Chloroflexota bacterium]